MRGFAILLVIFYHYFRLNGSHPSVLGFSWIAVQMFFVQSGLLITEILLEDKNRPFSQFIGRFYWRRTLRIFPVYFAYVIAFAFIYLVINKPADFGQRAPYLFTFTYNYTRLISDLNFNSIWFIHFWSLAVEEQFYWVWPIVVYYLSKRGLKWFIISALFLAPLFRFWLANYILKTGYSQEMTGEITYAFTLSQFDGFAIGAAIPVFNLRERIKSPGKWTIITMLIVLIIGLINYLSIKKIQPDYSITSLGISVGEIVNLQHVWSYSALNVFFLFITLYIIKESYQGIFNHHIPVSFGKIAYGMYIFHFAILFCVFSVDQRFIHNSIISIALAIMICFGVAYLSYNYYEKKFLTFRNFWDK